MPWTLPRVPPCLNAMQALPAAPSGARPAASRCLQRPGCAGCGATMAAACTPWWVRVHVTKTVSGCPKVHTLDKTSIGMTAWLIFTQRLQAMNGSQVKIGFKTEKHLFYLGIVPARTLAWIGHVYRQGAFARKMKLLRCINRGEAVLYGLAVYHIILHSSDAFLLHGPGCSSAAEAGEPA